MTFRQSLFCKYITAATTSSRISAAGKNFGDPIIFITISFKCLTSLSPVLPHAPFDVLAAPDAVFCINTDIGCRLFENTICIPVVPQHSHTFLSFAAFILMYLLAEERIASLLRPISAPTCAHVSPER